MRLLIVQIFFFALEIVDLGGNKLDLADGHITELVLATTNQAERAEKIGDITPDYCLGNPKYRMITILEFSSHHSAPARAVINKVARHRADSAARKLQKRYDALHIKRDAASDVLVATDFDGNVAREFSVSLGERVFEVLVLDGKGKVVQRWSDVSTADALDAALRSAAQ